MRNVTIGDIEPAEISETTELIRTSFNKFVAPGYSANGLAEFFRFIEPEATRKRLSQNAFMLVAREFDRVVGIIEVRDCMHIALLFTVEKHQKRGIAKMLLQAAIEKCLQRQPSLQELTVNSSPFAADIYEKLGFQRLGQEQTINGIRFVPMVLKLPR